MSSGYTPAFESLYSGSLCGKWPAAPVWASLIPLMDARGRIDMSYDMIHRITGWPMELLKLGIEQLEAPDPESRSPDEEGRRLVRLHEHRTWGWRAVNHGLYREKARLMNKNERETQNGSNAQRMADRRRPPPTAGDPLSYSYSDTEEVKTISLARAGEGSNPPNPPNPPRTSVAKPGGDSAEHSDATSADEHREQNPNPIHDWRRVPDVDHDAMRTWLAYLDQAGKRISPATEVSMAKVLAATGNAEHQRKVIAYHIEVGWRSIRNVDLNPKPEPPSGRPKTRFDRLKQRR